MVIDHLGVVVKSIDDGINQWKTLFGYKQMTDMVENSLQKVKVVFMNKENSLPVKLIEPTDESSPIYAFAMRGGGVHHICFKADNLNQAISDLNQHPSLVKVLVKPQPGEAFDNENIAFALAKNNLNIELIDTHKRAKRII